MNAFRDFWTFTYLVHSLTWFKTGIQTTIHLQYALEQMGSHFCFLCKEKDAKSPFVRIPICSRITSSHFSKLPILVFPVAAGLRIAEFSTWRGNQSSVRNSHSIDMFSSPGKLVLLVCEQNAVWSSCSVSRLFSVRESTHTTLWLLRQ